MEHELLVRELDRLVAETYSLWEAGWVTFNWRGYSYDHVQRVRNLSLNLCRQESGDSVTIELAALLHDITKPYDGEILVDQGGARIVDSSGHWRNHVRRPARGNVVTQLYDGLALAGRLHNESGATIAYHLLGERGMDKIGCARVSRTIRDHLRPKGHSEIESRCLYDADTIDANIGLPAFVRNIYINLHFHDERKSAESAPVAKLLRDTPQDYVRPYVIERLPGWVERKLRDFIPRLLTDSGRELALARLDRLESVCHCLAEELDDYASNSQRGRLSVILHFMKHRDDPSIAAETEFLANTQASRRLASARALITSLQREANGVE